MNGSILGRLTCFSDTAWALLQLERDILYKHIDPSKRRDVVETAWECGRTQADIWLKEHPGQTFSEYFDTAGVSISTDNKKQKPPVMLFATYKFKPERITLYKDAIDSVCRIFEDMSRQSIIELLLAHEYYHRVEQMSPEEAPFCYRVEYAIGRWKRRGILRQYSEVAAAAFAGRACGVDFYPAIFDALLLSSCDSSALALFTDRLKSISMEL